MENHLHIVSYAIPYPPDYGGVIDVFYRIKSLNKLGIKIHLHCFDYMGEKNKELEDLCFSVHYYHRKLGFRYHLSVLPYIVSTRINKELIDNIINFEAPIFFEGLHTTFGIKSPALKERRKVVRAHNIEHEYYRLLGNIETTIWKKIYYYTDALRLKCYEKVLRYANNIASISLKDDDYFKKKYGKTFFLPASHPFSEVKSNEGFGEYILFHGNLQVGENVQIAEWIIRNIAPKISHPIYIAGKKPAVSLVNLCRQNENVKLIADPDDDTMHRLIQEAHINLLPLFETSGLKLKLLYALYSGRHCIVNSIMTEGTMLDSLCTIANSADEMVVAIKRLFSEPFSLEQIEDRRKKLALNYDNLENAKKLVKVLFE